VNTKSPSILNVELNNEGQKFREDKENLGGYANVDEGKGRVNTTVSLKGVTKRKRKEGAGGEWRGEARWSTLVSREGTMQKYAPLSSPRDKERKTGARKE